MKRCVASEFKACHAAQHRTADAAGKGLSTWSSALAGARMMRDQAIALRPPRNSCMAHALPGADRAPGDADPAVLAIDR